MTNFFLFMVMDEKSNNVQIIHSVTDFFSPSGTEDDNIKSQAISFRGNSIGDQLPPMFQVTDAAFDRLKVKVPSLITIKQEMDVGVLTNQTLLIHGGYLPKETVPTLFLLPGAWK